jgi:hypothetical protein
VPATSIHCSLELIMTLSYALLGCFVFVRTTLSLGLFDGTLYCAVFVFVMFVTASSLTVRID